MQFFGAIMQQLNWDDVRFFLAVARADTLRAVGDALQVNHTTVSRRLAAMERALGVELFHRTSRHWTLSTAGEAILQSAEEMDASAHAVCRLVANNSAALSGRLRIAADLCMQNLLVPIVVEFAKAYPAIELDYLPAESVDPHMPHVDVALLGTNSPPQDLLGKKVCEMAFAVYGTAEWRTRLETETAADIVVWKSDQLGTPSWLPQGLAGPGQVHRATSSTLLRDLIAAGAGIGLLGCLLGDPEPDLVRIAEPISQESLGVWVVSQPDLRTTARIRVFRDFVFQALQSDASLLEGRAHVP